MDYFKDGQTRIAYQTMGLSDGPAVVWAHGWGHDHKAFTTLAESLPQAGRHVLIDFPGFGESPAPDSAWGSGEYAEALAEFISDKGPVIWVGHSFGCRVGLQIAAKHPEMVSGLFLIAAAGLPRKRGLAETISLKTRITLFKTLRKILPAENLYKIFGSPDYKNAGALRQTLVKVINEDLSNIAEKVNCPVMLAYGTNDMETPLEMGERFNRLIRNSDLLRFDGLDHYSILGAGRHQVAPHLKKFIEKYGQRHA